MDEPREVINPPSSTPARVITVREEPEDDPFIKWLRSRDALMDKAYDEELAQERRPEAVRISYSDIEDGDGSTDHRIRRMTEIIAKYGEYTKRIKDDERGSEYPLPKRSDYYRREVSRILLARGEVNTGALGKAIIATHGYIDRSRFNTAAAVIQSYIRDGGKKVVRGTGLPNFTGRNT